jgi:hypothetical protein
MNRPHPKADEEHGKSEDSGQESGEHGIEQAIDDDGASEEAEESVVGEGEVRGRQATPAAASRVRPRSGGENASPQAVKRLNLGRTSCGAQQDTVGRADQGAGILATMNQLDPRVIYAGAAAAGVDPREMYARIPPMPLAPEHGHEDTGADTSDSSEGGSDQGGDQGANRADDEDDGGADEEPGSEGTGGGSQVHEGGTDGEVSTSHEESIQEREGSLYTPSESGTAQAHKEEHLGQRLQLIAIFKAAPRAQMKYFLGKMILSI